MMLENKEAVIFDLDGTITDSMWVWADIDRTFFEQRKIPMPPTLNKEIEGMSFTETAEYFIRTFQLPETVEELKDIWNRIALDKYAHETPLKPGAGEILKYLKEHHIKTGIATSNSRLLLDVFLKERDLEPYIDAVTTSCDVNKGKPEPDVYLKTAEKLQVNRNIVWYLKTSQWEFWQENGQACRCVPSKMIIPSTLPLRKKRWRITILQISDRFWIIPMRI